MVSVCMFVCVSMSVCECVYGSFTDQQREKRDLSLGWSRLRWARVRLYRFCSRKKKKSNLEDGPRMEEKNV